MLRQIWEMHLVSGGIWLYAIFHEMKQCTLHLLWCVLECAGVTKLPYSHRATSAFILIKIGESMLSKKKQATL